jgi:chaperonin GroEL
MTLDATPRTQDVRESLLAGVNKLANVVRLTLGPRGLPSSVERPQGEPALTRSGVAAAIGIALVDKAESSGAAMLRDVAVATAKAALDGSATATLLAHSILTEGAVLIRLGGSASELKRGIDQAVEDVVQKLKTLAEPCTARKSLIDIATVSADGDAHLGAIIADAILAGGEGGVIAVEDASTLEDRLQLVEGLQMYSGFLSTHFINNQDDNSCDLEDAYVLLYDGIIHDVDALIALLAAVGALGKSLLIAAQDIEDSVLRALLWSGHPGVSTMCVVKAPENAVLRHQLFQSLAKFTGSRVISHEASLAEIPLRDLGCVRKAHVTQHVSVITKEDGDCSDRSYTLRNLWVHVRSANANLFGNNFFDFPAGLSCGIAIIRVGAQTQREVARKMALTANVLHATYAAFREGMIPGGGVALFRAAEQTKNIHCENYDQQMGVKLVQWALQEPLRQIIDNAGDNPAEVLALIHAGKGNHGYNAKTGMYGDMVEMGIVDPFKVAKVALEVAASVAGHLATFETLMASMRGSQIDSKDR